MESELLSAFIDEAEARLAAIRGGVLPTVHNGAAPAEIETHFRSAQQLKSAAAAFALRDIENSAEELMFLLARCFESAGGNTLDVLDLIVRIEASLATLRMSADKNVLDVPNFVDEAFESLFAAPELELPPLDFPSFDIPEPEPPPAPAIATATDPELPPAEEEFEVDAELLEVFAEEAEDLLRSIESNLEILKVNSENTDALWEIRRNAHTLKGAAGIVGLKKPSELAHRVEDLLDRLADNKPSSNERIVELLLVAAECLRSLTAGENSPAIMRKITELYGDFDTVLTSLSDTLAEQPQHGPPVPIVEAPIPAVIEEPEAPAERVLHAGPANPPRPIVRVSLERLDDLVKNVRDLVVSRSVFEQRLTEFEQQIDELHNSTRRLQATSSKLEIDFEASMLEGSPVTNLFSLPTHKRLERAGSTETGHFDALEFDRYTEFHQSTRELAETTSDTFAINTALDTLHENLENLYDQQRRLIEEMQERLMKIRMVQFSTLTTRLQRAVHVTCEEENKKAEITVENAHLEIDTQILDALIEPLMHLLKNAVVHGIEPPDTRRLLGKPESGRIAISLSNEETHIVLTVSDDGRGISSLSLKEKAVRMGLISAERVEAMNEEQLLELIFLPGLTTAEKLSLSAGRGVGMSIVKESIETHKGTISIESVPQRGTTFTVRMPLPLAVTNVIVVRSRRQSYALPVKMIRHIGEIPMASVRTEAAEAILPLGTGSYRFRHLEELLSRPRVIDPGRENTSVLIVESAAKSCAIAVDEVIKSEAIVIKSLGKPLDSIKGLLGAAILGNGDLVPILDMPHLLKNIDKHVSIPAPVVEDSNELTVLIVDDSPSVRHMTSKVITAAGWIAETAKDGVDALDKLRTASKRPAVILSDIEMPRMDGYELLATLRENPKFADIPVVFITSRSGEKHREKAFSSGITEYLAKPYEESDLVNLIKRLSAPK